MSLITFFLSVVIPIQAQGLDDATLAAIDDDFEVRQAEVIRQQMFTPYPNATQPEPESNYAWNRLNFALAIFYSNKDETEPPQNFINAANKAIIDICDVYLDAGAGEITKRDGGLHWSGNHLIRLHELFGSDSRFYPGLLSAEAESSIRELIWSWVSREATLAETDLSLNNTWRIHESENHSAMMDQLSWGGAKILRRFEPYKSMTYDDGSTAEQQYEAWTNFLIEYLRERGKRGLFVEYRSNTYVKYTSQNFYNYFDLTENPTLRELARSVLDLLWADAAHDTIEGFEGGASARQARDADLDALRGSFSFLGWYYYGEGQEKSLHPGHMMLVTSGYRIPDVVKDIALDISGRGSYEYFSRKPGVSVAGKEGTYSQTNHYWVDYENNNILRYSYVTPDFVLGTHMYPELPYERWTAISSQNRFHSAMLRTDSGFVQIVPQCLATTSNFRGVNEQWSVQKHGTLITQKTRTSRNVADMRVYIPSGSGVTVEESNDWIFIDTGYTFSGVRVATGGYQWLDANWIELNEEYSPVIVEVARSGDYADFDAFKTAATSSALSVVTENDLRRLEYAGLGNTGNFVFHMDTDDMPTIDGESYDLSPDYTYKSPFLNAEWPASTVTVEKDSRSLTLNFDLALPLPEAMNPQWRNSVYLDHSWYRLDGFGYFIPGGDYWLYHYEMGWLYSPPAVGNGIWLYVADNEEWIWATNEFTAYLTTSGDVYTPVKD